MSEIGAKSCFVIMPFGKKSADNPLWTEHDSIGKEIRVGIVDGLALAVTCGLAVFAWSRSVGLAVVMGIAMILSMVAAGISGALVPIVLIRLGQDPATAASIILTTVTDVAGFLAFLGTASLLSTML